MKWPEGLTAYPESPATEAEIAALVESVSAPLTELEIAELQAVRRAIAGDVGFDPASWPLPGRPLPDSYLAFLRYSNGGFFSGLHRNFDSLFKTDEVREYMLGYDIPRWMPLSCPFGFDGGGTFYLFDMREEPVNGDYPVLFAHAGNLDYEDAITLAGSFAELIATQLGPP